MTTGTVGACSKWSAHRQRLVDTRAVPLATQFHEDAVAVDQAARTVRIVAVLLAHFDVPRRRQFDRAHRTGVGIDVDDRQSGLPPWRRHPRILRRTFREIDRNRDPVLAAAEIHYCKGAVICEQGRPTAIAANDALPTFDRVVAITLIVAQRQVSRPISAAAMQRVPSATSV